MLLYPLEKGCKQSSLSAVTEEQVAGRKWSAALQGIVQSWVLVPHDCQAQWAL